MATETRTVHFTFDPALKAYLAWLGDRDFDGAEYATFAAGYRARVDEEAPPADDHDGH